MSVALLEVYLELKLSVWDVVFQFGALCYTVLKNMLTVLLWLPSQVRLLGVPLAFRALGVFFYPRLPGSKCFLPLQSC